MRYRSTPDRCVLGLTVLFLFVHLGCTDDASPSASTDRIIKRASDAKRKEAPRRAQHDGLGGEDQESRPKVYQPNVPPAQRTFFVSAAAVEDGAGTEQKPWGDLQAALCKLEPGDRLIVLPGSYRGPFTVDRPCKDGVTGAPIVVEAREDAILLAREGQSALVLRRPFWVVQDAEIMSGKSRVAAVVVEGPDAHDILIEHVHLHNGWGDGLRVGRDVRRLTIANSHIHNFGHPKHGQKGGGVVLEEGVAEITIVGNNIHQGLAGPVRMGDRVYAGDDASGVVDALPGVTLRTNEMQAGWDGS